MDASNAGGDSGDEWHVSARPLSQETAVPESWGLVRAGCLEGETALVRYRTPHTHDVIKTI